MDFSEHRWQDFWELPATNRFRFLAEHFSPLICLTRETWEYIFANLEDTVIMRRYLGLAQIDWEDHFGHEFVRIMALNLELFAYLCGRVEEDPCGSSADG